MPSKPVYHRPLGQASPKEHARQYDRARQVDKNFYSSTRWVKLRRAYLAEHPLCEECLRHRRVTAAEHVHHKRARKDHPELAHDWDNLEALCQPCHNAEEVR